MDKLRLKILKVHFEVLGLGNLGLRRHYFQFTLSMIVAVAIP
jgi:hypothetical protein